MKALVLLGLGFISLAACSASVTGGTGGGGTSSPDAGGGGKGDGGGSSATDSGGVSSNPATLQFPASCPSFSACGGDVVGSWDYASGCVDNPFGNIDQSCPGLAVVDPKGSVAGTITFTATTVVRRASGSFDATLAVPASCSEPAGGCPAIEASLKGAGFATSVCAAASAGGCSCSLTKTIAIDDSDTYTISGNTLTTGGGGQYDFCVSGSSLSYREASQQKEAGQFVLAKR